MRADTRIIRVTWRGHELGLAFDSHNLFAHKNGAWINGVDLAVGTGATSGLSGTTWFPAASDVSSSSDTASVTANFDALSFV
jgi:hypothetical protein